MKSIETISLSIWYGLAISLNFFPECQAGSYPSLEDVGRFKPVHITPNVTCGTPVKSIYCQPVSTAEELAGTSCIHRTCRNDCPGRDRSASDYHLLGIDLMKGNLGECVTRNYKDTRGTRKPSYEFLHDSKCFTNPSNVPRTGEFGQFTLSIWIKQQPMNAG